MTSNHTDMNIGASYLDEAFRSLRGHKRLAEGAMAQINDEQFFRVIDPEANSIAILVKHLAGNMRSRSTDFLTTDGEKAWRKRDQEFLIDPGATRADLMQVWEEGWRIVFDAVKSLTPEDLLRTVTVRGQEQKALQAVNRQVAHYAYHVGQIVLLAKHFKSTDWKTLSVPRAKPDATSS